MKKKIIVISVLLIAAFAAGILFYVNRDGKKAVYKTEKISRGEVKSVVTATGTVNAVTTVSVGTQVSGTIRTLFADFNSPVKKGQLLAQIDPATFRAQVDQARANLLSAQANLEKAGVAVVDARRTYERNKELFPRTLSHAAISIRRKRLCMPHKPSRKSARRKLRRRGPL